MKVTGSGIKKDFIRETAETNVYTALAGCDIVLSPGELTVIQGRSGGGKTTLLNILAGVLPPTEGSVYYDEKDIYSLSDNELSVFRNRHIGYIPQGKSAIASLNVMENIALHFLLYGENVGKEADELIREFGIEGIKTAMPEELSGGELRRMAIVRSLVRKPDILFADEPTGDLDDENTELVFRELKKTADSGTAVLVVTHENGVEKYADRIYRMNGGRLDAWE